MLPPAHAQLPPPGRSRATAGHPPAGRLKATPSPATAAQSPLQPADARPAGTTSASRCNNSTACSMPPAALHNAAARSARIADIHNNFAGVLLLLTRPRNGLHRKLPGTRSPRRCRTSRRGAISARRSPRSASAMPAIASFTRALELNPRTTSPPSPNAPCSSLHHCDWRGLRCGSPSGCVIAASRQRRRSRPFLLRAAGHTADVLAAARRVASRWKLSTAPVHRINHAIPRKRHPPRLHLIRFPPAPGHPAGVRTVRAPRPHPVSSCSPIPTVPMTTSGRRRHHLRRTFDPFHAISAPSPTMTPPAASTTTRSTFWSISTCLIHRPIVLAIVVTPAGARAGQAGSAISAPPAPIA